MKLRYRLLTATFSILIFHLSTKPIEACVHTSREVCYVLIAPAFGAAEAGVSFGIGEIARSKDFHSNYWPVYGVTTGTFLVSALTYSLIETHWKSYFEEHETINSIFATSMMIAIPIAAGILTYKLNLKADDPANQSSPGFSINLPQLSF